MLLFIKIFSNDTCEAVSNDCLCHKKHNYSFEGYIILDGIDFLSICFSIFTSVFRFFIYFCFFLEGGVPLLGILTLFLLSCWILILPVRRCSAIFYFRCVSSFNVQPRLPPLFSAHYKSNCCLCVIWALGKEVGVNVSTTGCCRSLRRACCCVCLLSATQKLPVGPITWFLFIATHSCYSCSTHPATWLHILR